MTTITLPRAVVEQALETIEGLTRDRLFTAEWAGKHGATITALRAALEQQAEPDAYGYASRLAVAIWEKHYKDAAPQWTPLDGLMGVLTQIDNMTSGLTRRAQQANHLTIERLRVALVASRIIDPAAVEDPDGYDDGVTLHRIEALHRRLT